MATRDRYALRVANEPLSATCLTIFNRQKGANRPATLTRSGLMYRNETSVFAMWAIDVRSVECGGRGNGATIEPKPAAPIPIRCLLDHDDALIGAVTIWGRSMDVAGWPQHRP